MTVLSNTYSLCLAKCKIFCAECAGKTTPAMSFLLHAFIVEQKQCTNPPLRHSTFQTFITVKKLQLCEDQLHPLSHLIELFRMSAINFQTCAAQERPFVFLQSLFLSPFYTLA